MMTGASPSFRDRPPGVAPGARPGVWNARAPRGQPQVGLQAFQPGPTRLISGSRHHAWSLGLWARDRDRVQVQTLVLPNRATPVKQREREPHGAPRPFAQGSPRGAGLGGPQRRAGMVRAGAVVQGPASPFSAMPRSTRSETPAAWPAGCWDYLPGIHPASAAGAGAAPGSSGCARGSLRAPPAPSAARRAGRAERIGRHPDHEAAQAGCLMRRQQDRGNRLELATAYRAPPSPACPRPPPPPLCG